MFVVGVDGSISGSVAGGTGGADALIIYETDTSGSLFNVAGADSAGTAVLYGKSIVYSGLDRREVMTGNDVERRITGTPFGDTIVLRADPNNANQMIVDFGDLNWFESLFATTLDFVTFLNPTSALVLEGGLGADSITVESLSPNWHAGAALYIFGNRRGDGDPAVFEDDFLADTVTFTGDVDTNDGVIEVYAAHIAVAADVVVNAGDNYIIFRVRQIGAAFAENVLAGVRHQPFGVDLHRRPGRGLRRRHLPHRPGRGPQPGRVPRCQQGARQLRHHAADGLPRRAPAPAPGQGAREAVDGDDHDRRGRPGARHRHGGHLRHLQRRRQRWCPGQPVQHRLRPGDGDVDRRHRHRRSHREHGGDRHHRRARRRRRR